MTDGELWRFVAGMELSRRDQTPVSRCAESVITAAVRRSLHWSQSHGPWRSDYVLLSVPVTV